MKISKQFLKRVIKEEIEKKINEALTDDVKQYTQTMLDDVENISFDNVEASVESIKNLSVKIRRIKVFFAKSNYVEFETIVRVIEQAKEILKQFLINFSLDIKKQGDFSSMRNPRSSRFVPSAILEPLILAGRSLFSISADEFEEMIKAEDEAEKIHSKSEFLYKKRNLTKLVEFLIEKIESETEQLQEAQNVEIIELTKNNPQAQIIYDELKEVGIPHFIIDNILLKAFSGDGDIE